MQAGSLLTTQLRVKDNRDEIHVTNVSSSKIRKAFLTYKRRGAALRFHHSTSLVSAVTEHA
jgi:hypothetical protein